MIFYKARRKMSSIKKKIYYHDTDAGGVVYYANYLKFFEEGRTEYLEERGIFTEELLKQGIAFVVANVDIEYLKPVKYKDTIEIHTEIEKTGNSSIIFLQKAVRDGIICCQAKITLVCVNGSIKPIRIPQEIINLLRR